MLSKFLGIIIVFGPAPVNIRLVGEHEHLDAVLLDARHDLPNKGKRFKLFGIFQANLIAERTVPIKKNCLNHLKLNILFVSYFTLRQIMNICRRPLNSIAEERLLFPLPLLAPFPEKSGEGLFKFFTFA